MKRSFDKNVKSSFCFVLRQQLKYNGMTMTQSVKEQLFVCDRHGLDSVYVVSRAVGENCSQCKKKMDPVAWIETRPKEEARTNA
jgi:hypothetical protein